MALGGGPYPLNWHPTTALAQHHGVPTFLLDWTENPWFAAHFAAIPSRDLDDRADICVWALDIKKVDDGASNAIGIHGIGSIMVNRPAKSHNQFLASQDGLLTFLLDDGEYWEQHGAYLPLEDLIEKMASKVAEVEKTGDTKEIKYAKKRLFSDGQAVLRKIVLSKEHVPKLRQLLLLEGITTAHLMPTLDNVAKTSLTLTVDAAKA